MVPMPAATVRIPSMVELGMVRACEESEHTESPQPWETRTNSRPSW